MNGHCRTGDTTPFGLNISAALACDHAANILSLTRFSIIIAITNGIGLETCINRIQRHIALGNQSGSAALINQLTGVKGGIATDINA